ncbi:MAG: putative fatty-acid--CoA ligase [Ilumatobacteraceae bacterium]|nr:putative fatty-acid--CoA ligase [Ilumatobacteraceae bacterium]
MSSAALPTAEQFRRWGVDPGWSQVIDVPGHDGVDHRWHVLDRAPVGTPLATIVCVHGNPTWSYLWHHLIEQMGDRYRVIAVDQLGMGWSERTDRRRYADRVRDLDGVIDALAIEGPMVIAGHDWGGAISMGWAGGAAPRRELAGMVLCNTGIAVPAGRKAPWLIRLAATGPVTSVVGHRTRTFVDGTIALSWKRLPAEARQALRAPYRTAARRRAIADFIDDVPFTDTHPSAAAIADVAERLRSLKVPTLLAWGAADPVFNDDFAHDLAQRMPHADRHRFPGVGHLSPLEADVAGVVEQWLADRVSMRRSAGRRATAAADVRPAWSALVDRCHDTTIAFVDGSTGGRTSFAELHDRVMGLAAGLAATGVQPGDRVALLVPPSVDLLTAVYGCWRAGAVTVIADRGLGLRGLGRAVRGAHVQWVIGPPAALAAARTMRWAAHARTIAVGSRPSLGSVATLDELMRSTAPLPPEPAPDDIAAVLYTSGATGPAKGVRYRHGQLAAQRDALATTYAITADDRLVAAFAPFALYGPALGITSTIPDVDVTKPGTLTAEALGTACASIDATIVFASPAALANVARTSTGADARLDRIRLALSAGAPVPIATLRATAVLMPHAELHTPYGMTECLPVADVSLDQIVAAGAGAGVCVGMPVPGAEVMVTALGFDAGAIVVPLDGLAMGEVLVRAPWLSDGYDQLWRTEHDARPTDGIGRSWHRSGDVGHVDADGRLWIEGRSMHVIHAVNGPITPVPVEIAVEQLDAVERAAAVGVGPVGCQQLVVVVEQPTIDDGLADEAMSASVRGVVDVRVAAVLSVQALPVDIRHNTKIDRTAVAAWAAAVLSGERARRPGKRFR